MTEEEISFSGIIYKITNTVNNKVYIGQTKLTLQQRWGMHKRSVKKQSMDGLLQRAFRKYGIEVFLIDVLEDNIPNIEMLNTKEKYYIEKYASFGECGYNMTTGGEGFVVRQSTKNKHSCASKGRKHSEQTKAVLREKAKQRKHSEFTKKILSEKMKGNKYSDPNILKQYNKNRTDTTVYVFTHEQYGKVICNCSMLAKCFNLSNSAVHNVVNGIYKSTKGWIKV